MASHKLSTLDAVRAALEPDILLRQLEAMGDIGLVPDPEGQQPGGTSGRTRLAVTEADKAGRDQLVAWMEELDLDVHVDAVGNIFGLLQGTRDAAPVMAGSHIDTVRSAGALDGVYGVLSSLAVARAFRRAGYVPPRPFIVAAFTNEEGVRFQPDMLGSLVYAGGIDLKDALNATDVTTVDGPRLGDELARIGYAGTLAPGHFRPAAYWELHVEQGPVLAHEGMQIGVVEGVQGISWQRLSIEGAANHAGTTPTALRHDAGLAAAHIITWLRDMAEQSGTTLATVGSLRFEPDLINVIPSRVEMTVDIRDPDDARLLAAETALAAYVQDLAARDGLRISSRRLVRFEPVPFHPAMIGMVEATAQRIGLACRRMVSGAGHDAQMMARICPVGMIFVPSQGGLSHCPQEHTDSAHLDLGLQVLLDCVLGCFEQQP